MKHLVKKKYRRKYRPPLVSMLCTRYKRLRYAKEGDQLAYHISNKGRVRASKKFKKPKIKRIP